MNEKPHVIVIRRKISRGDVATIVVGTFYNKKAAIAYGVEHMTSTDWMVLPVFPPPVKTETLRTLIAVMSK